jgi:hypothetical protein
MGSVAGRPPFQVNRGIGHGLSTGLRDEIWHRHEDVIAVLLGADRQLSTRSSIKPIASIAFSIKF